MIEIDKAVSQKSELLDFSRLLHKESGDASIRHTEAQMHDIDSVLDRTIITASDPAISNGKEVSLEYAIANTDRAVGAMLSGLIADKFGNEGLPDESISVRFKGSAGQSFGAFLAHGISFKLEGEANDYLGKGLSGGRIAVAPQSEAISRQRKTPLPATRSFMEPQAARFISTAVSANVLPCVIQVPLPLLKVSATTVANI